MIWTSIRGLAITALAALPFSTHAVPLVQLHGSNAGIQTMSFMVSGTTITINETWNATGTGMVLIAGLDSGVDYTVVVNALNASPTGWTGFAFELLDSSLDPDDALDPVPQPSFVPNGYSTSSGIDLLSFAQGSGIPRTGGLFPSLVAGEAGYGRDFLDFSNGLVSNLALNTFSFGLRDGDGGPAPLRPILLAQRPNETSVPEPATLGLIGLGCAALGWARRRRSA